jgi:hypothetical protein
MPHIMTDPAEIRQWAEARAGYPMLMDMPGMSEDRVLLQITFGQHALNADNNEGPDRLTGGYQLVSWDDWCDALEKQGLALKVNDDIPGVLDNDFEFVPRSGEGLTTDAAKQPPVVSVEQLGEEETPDRGR